MKHARMNAKAPVNRRKFLRRVFWGGAALAGAVGLAVGYGFWEASLISISRKTINLLRLPQSFNGKTIAVLADFHHGPFVGLPFIRHAVELARTLNADAYALVGDFAHKGTHTEEQLPPCLDALSPLEAPLGVFAVPGNHDMQHSGQVYRDEIQTTSLTDLTNRAVPVTIGSDTLWFAGVDDLWWGKPDLAKALQGVPKGEPVVLLSHNPDYAEVCPDPRVDLILSGHTHGGQVYLPILGSPWTPSAYGNKYRAGLVSGRHRRCLCLVVSGRRQCLCGSTVHPKLTCSHLRPASEKREVTNFTSPFWLVLT